MGWKEPLWIILFAFSWVPVGLLAVTTLFGVEVTTYPQDFGIYNEDYNGLSDFRTTIEGNYEVMAIQSTLSVLSRYSGDSVLAIMGPVRDFSLDTVWVISQHLQAGGGVLIADDFGTANSSFGMLNGLLNSSLQGYSLPINVKGFLSFAGGVLFDLDSYDTDPRLPIIRDFTAGMDGGALTQGVTDLHLNWASALHPQSLVGFSGVAWTTTRAWCEKNITDPDPWPDHGELNGRLPIAGAIDMGAMAQGGGRMVVVSDPSIFANTMWSRFAGNRRFGQNVIDWLSFGNTSRPIFFAEHLLAVPFTSGEFFFGLYLGRVLWLSSMPLLNFAYPLITIIGIKKYLPDLKKPEVKSVSDVFLRRGQTYFSERMAYYRTQGNYARVIKMLYRKMRRDLKKKHLWSEYDSKKVWDLLQYKDHTVQESDFFKKINQIEEISSKPGKSISETEMMELFFFIRGIEEKLIETRK